MAFQEIELDAIDINRANDRHGELENETAAIAELFRLREAHMKKLAEDIVAEGGIYDAPLLAREGDRYVVFDGNRRITCVKLICAPDRAPSQELQAFFTELRNRWNGDLPTSTMCQVEEDREKIDAILYRRHTGSQGGVGQSTWDDRAKRNFVERTGQGGRVNVADEIEAILTEEGRLPDRTIPRSTLNRLLSSEANRERVGVSVTNNHFRLTHAREEVIDVLARIAEDLATRQVVLGDLWDNQGKQAYINRLEVEGLLPAENDRLPEGVGEQPRRRRRTRQGRPPARQQQATFVPTNATPIPWRADQARARAIWDELQNLRLDRHPNAVSALVRVLVELAAEGYLRNRALDVQDTLSRNVVSVADDLLAREIIDREYRHELDRLSRNDELISIRSMQRYVHSEHFAPIPRELETYWT